MRKIVYSVLIGFLSAMLVFALGVQIRPYVNGMSAHRFLWSFYEWAGWWWWGSYCVLSVAGLLYMFRLLEPETKWGLATRVVLIAGFTCYGFSWGNNALGPIAGWLVLLGVVMVIRQLALGCDVKRRARAASTKGRSFSGRWLGILTGE